MDREINNAGTNISTGEVQDQKETCDEVCNCLCSCDWAVFLDLFGNLLCCILLSSDS